MLAYVLESFTRRIGPPRKCVRNGILFARHVGDTEVKLAEEFVPAAFSSGRTTSSIHKFPVPRLQRLVISFDINPVQANPVTPLVQGTDNSVAFLFTGTPIQLSTGKFPRKERSLQGYIARR